MIMIIDKDHLEGRGHVDDRPRLEQNHRRGGEGTHEQIWEKYFLNYFLQVPILHDYKSRWTVQVMSF